MKNKFITINSIILTIILIIPSVISINNLTTFENSNQSKSILNIDDDKILSIINDINESLVIEYLTTLVNLAPRYSGTYGCEKSAEYIFKQFINHDLDARYQHWTAFGNRWHPQIFMSQNVEGTLNGVGENPKTIVFGAHYDTIQYTPGANDDGSGTVAVMAAASILSKYEFNNTIKFVTFSGEENGLHGSWRYVEEAFEKNQDILYYFNADMIGHAVTPEGSRNMGVPYTEDAFWIREIFEYISELSGLNFGFGGGLIGREGRGWGDYFPFAAYGHETVSCWESDHDPNMHTEIDDLSNINFSYLVNTTRLITATIAYLADLNEFYPQIKITSPKRSSLYYNGQNLGRNFKKKYLLINRPYTQIDHNQNSIIVDDIWIWAEESASLTPIERVEFYYDDKLEYTDTSDPFKWFCNKFSFGDHRISVIAYDELGRSTSDFINIYFINIRLK